MVPEDHAGRVRAAADLLAPSSAGRGQVDLAEDDVDDAVEDLVLVLDVVVDRHRLDAELLGQGPDGQGREAVGIRDRDRATQHAVAAEARASATAGCGWIRHETPAPLCSRT